MSPQWTKACVGLALWMFAACADVPATDAAVEDETDDTVEDTVAPVEPGEDPPDTPEDPPKDESITVWTEVLPAVPVVVINHPVAGEIYTGVPAAGASALVFVFHGSGGDASVVENPEMTAILNEVVGAGAMYVALDSDAGGTGKFNDEAAPPANPDWTRLSAVYASLLDQGEVTSSDPVFFLGYSAGGAFASWSTHAGLAADWPVAGLILQQSSGFSDLYGLAANVDQFLALTEHDERLQLDAIRERFAQHEALGNDNTKVEIGELDLHPTRFVRGGSFDVDQSQQIFDEAVLAGIYNSEGVRQFPIEIFEETVDTFVDTYDVIFPKPTKAQLNVVLATHAINGGAATEIGQFVTDRL